MSSKQDIRKLILLVSDAPFPELLLGRHFCEYNSIEPYCTMEQVKEVIESKSFDYILVDYMIPHINLHPLVMLLRTHNNTKVTPIYMLDTQGDPLNRTFCKEILGVDGYITGSIPLFPTKPEASPSTSYELDW